MKKYEDMSDFEINKEVALIKNESLIFTEDDRVYLDTDEDSLVDYCNNPSDSWVIIVENKINIEWRDSMRLHPLAKGTGGNSCHWSDKNPLRAAMICFLKMKDTEK